VPGVIHRKLARSDDYGFAASFIPESDSGPHMALAGHHRYFKRAGDRFYPMEHFDISDMFGRRQRPALRLAYSLHLGSTSGGPQGNRREIPVLFSLVNEGRASAVAPYARFQIHGAFRLHPAGAASEGEAANFRMRLSAVRTLRHLSSAVVTLSSTLKCLFKLLKQQPNSGAIRL